MRPGGRCPPGLTCWPGCRAWTWRASTSSCYSLSSCTQLDTGAQTCLVLLFWKPVTLAKSPESPPECEGCVSGPACVGGWGATVDPVTLRTSLGPLDREAEDLPMPWMVSGDVAYHQVAREGHLSMPELHLLLRVRGQPHPRLPPLAGRPGHLWQLLRAAPGPQPHPRHPGLGVEDSLGPGPCHHIPAELPRPRHHPEGRLVRGGHRLHPALP